VSGQGHLSRFTLHGEFGSRDRDRSRKEIHVKRLLTCLALCGLALSPAVARADKIDLKLNDETPKVVKYLKDKGYKNVGVLHFRSQTATEKHPRFDSGTINANMADRLENLLVMHGSQAKNPEQPAFGVIHDASGAALKQRVGAWFTRPEERKKLFKSDYPLAWGKESVKADAFLTGKVTLSEDLKKTRVVIECFDAKASEKIVKVAELSCDTDRNVIRDFNLPYTLTKAQHQALARGFKTARSRDQAQQADQKVDDVVLQQAKQQQQLGNKPQNKPGTQDGPATTQTIGGIALKITASGKEFTPAANSSQQGFYQMECPPRDTEIVMSLTNTTEKELGVVLKVAGFSTVGEQKEAPEQCRKWLVPPGKTYNIKGFYTGEKFDSLKKFVVKSKDEAKQAFQNGQQLENLDLIEIYVFESVDGGKPEGPMTISRGVNARGLRGDVAKKARSSYQSLKSSLVKEGRFKKARGRDGAEVIVPDTEGMNVPAPEEKDFPNPVEIKNMKIRLRPADAGVQTEQPKPEPQDYKN